MRHRTEGIILLLVLSLLSLPILAYAAAPTLSNLAISTPTAKNDTTETITATFTTSDSDGDNVSTAIDWRVNGTSFAMLNLNFDWNNSAGTGNFTDYSTENNTATLTGGTWNATGGRNNTGAINLRDTSTYVYTSKTYPSAQAFTVTIWFKTTTTRGGKLIGSGSSKTGASTNYDKHIYMNNSGQLLFGVYNGASNIVGTSTTYNDGQWHFAVGTLDASGMALYVDGVLQSNFSSVTSSSAYTGYWRVGYDNLNGWPTRPTSDGINATVDSAAVYNRSLSPGQILALYNNRSDQIVGAETEHDEKWNVCVTPNDGTTDGATSCTANMTITGPRITTLAIRSTYDTFGDDENLTAKYTTSDIDGDNISVTIDWRVNGTSIAPLLMSFNGNNSNGTGSTRSYSTFAVNGSVLGATWNATGGVNGSAAYEFDGIDDMINITNTTALDFQVVTISAWVKPRKDNMGNYARIVEKHTADSYFLGIDTTGTHFQGIFGNDTGEPYGTLVSTTTISANTWYHVVVMHNGSLDMLFVNGVNEVNQTNTAVLSNNYDNVHIGRRVHAADGWWNGTIDEVRIYNRSLSRQEVVALYQNRSELIVSQETTVGNNWSVCVTPSDGMFDGKAVCTSAPLINACTLTNITTPTTLSTNLYTCGDVYVMNGTALTFAANVSIVARNVYILQNSTINHTTLTRINITASGNSTEGNLYVEQNSSINGTARGYLHNGVRGNGFGPGGGLAVGNFNPGSGASHGGTGGMSASGASWPGNQTVYGNITHPNDYGSSGGSGDFSSDNAGDGGGLVVLNATGELQNDGRIEVDGELGPYGGAGSGGSVLLFAGTFDGTGVISATGGNGTGEGGSAGGGRIAVHYVTSTFTGTYTADGGTKAQGAEGGGAGTIYLKDRTTGDDTLIIDNKDDSAQTLNQKTKLTSEVGPSAYTNLIIRNATVIGMNLTITKTATISQNVSVNITINGTANITINDTIFFNGGLNATNVTVHPQATVQFLQSIYASDVVFSSGSTITARGTVSTRDITFASTSSTLLYDYLTARNVRLQTGSALTMPQANSTHTFRVNITAVNVTVESGAIINMSGKGYAGGTASNDGNGPGNSTQQSAIGSGGANHGGFGGLGGNGGAAGTAVYGDPIRPVTPGSGAGGADTAGGTGGGVILINATDTVNISGQLLAEGTNGTNGGQQDGGGGGSGGSIAITAATIVGSGNISVRGGFGGDVAADDGGGGSGGRMAIAYQSLTFTGALNVAGASAVGTGGAGQQGTLFWCQWSAGSISCPGQNGSITLTTAYSNTSTMNITRNLTGGSWNGTLVRWNETTTSDNLLANYTLTGLTASHLIKTFVNGTFNNSGFTDGSGNMPVRVVNASRSHEYLFIGNDSAPTFTMTWNGSLTADPLVYAGEDILCKVTPSDSDDFNATAYWTILNGTTTYNSSTMVVNLGVETQIAMVNGVVTHGLENWTCRVIVGDGMRNATQQEISVAIEANGLPAVQVANVTPQPAYTNDNLRGWCNATDIDNSVLSYHYIWYRNDTAYASGYADNGGANYTQGLLVNIANISASLTTKNENWTLQCRAFDDTVNSSWMNSTTLVINNTIPAITAFVVNSSNGTNTTSQDLTAYLAYTADNDSEVVGRVVEWRRNGTSILLAQVTFDENQSAGAGNVREYTIRQANGTANGDVTWNATGGRNATGAYEFDGVNDRINITDAYNPVAYTLEAWVKPRDNTSVTIIVKTTGAPTTNYQNEISITTAGVVEHYTWDGGGVVTTGTTAIPTNQWTHIVATAENGGFARVYVNGVEDGNPDTIGTIATGPSRWTIGSNSGRAGWFNGTIDEVRVWNRSLSGVEVWELYQNRSHVLKASETGLDENWTACAWTTDGQDSSGPTCSGGLLVVQGSEPSATLVVNSSAGLNTTGESLTAYTSTTDSDGDITYSAIDWRVNGTSIALLNMNFDTNNSNGTGSVRDYGTSGNNGSVIGATWKEGAGPGGDGAYFFDGVNDYIDLNAPSTLNLSGANEFTLMAWVRPTASAIGSGIITEMYTPTSTRVQYEMGVGMQSGTQVAQVGFYDGTWRIATAPSTLPTHAWTHIAGTWNGSVITLYLNGTRVANTTVAVSLPTTGIDSYRIGSRHDTTGTFDFFPGYIDDVVILNESLSPEQIAAIYGNGWASIVREETEVNENWTACVTPNDGWNQGAQVCSEGLLIVRGVDTINATITPDPAYVTGNLLGWCNGTNGIDTTVNYYWQWYRNGTINTSGYANNSGASYPEGVFVNVANISAVNLSHFENWTLGCQAVYSGLNGSWFNSTALTINNTAPVVSSLVVNSTSGSDLDEDNLTAYPTMTDANSDATRASIDWRVNGTSIAPIYFPFDVNNSAGTGFTASYSSFYNNGTISGATWNATGGVNGSAAYEFASASSNYISFNDSGLPSGQSNFTMCAWGKTTTVAAGFAWVVSYGTATTSDAVFIGRNAATLRIGAYADDITVNNFWSVNTWKHACLVYNTTHAQVYTDGVLNTTSAETWTIIKLRAYVGRQVNNAEYWSGTVDDVRIYNRTLSAAQILAIYQNRTDFIHANETQLSQNWTACVTPNDRYNDGAVTCSNGLLIVNITDSCTPPSAGNNWLVYASDNCTKSLTSIDLGTGNLTVSGATGPGHLKLNNSNLTANNVWVVGVGNLTRIILENSAKIAIS